MGTPAVPWYHYSNHAEQCASVWQELVRPSFSTFPNNHNHKNNGTLNHEHYNHHDNDHVDGEVGAASRGAIDTRLQPPTTQPSQLKFTNCNFTRNHDHIQLPWWSTPSWDNHNHGSY
jgi:hypothetical protein